MASKEEKLLEALRSLTPPKGGAEGRGLRGSARRGPGEPPRPPGGPREERIEEQPDDEGPPPRNGTIRSKEPDLRGRRTIVLSVEEAGLFFLAAVLLVVLAFLLGWYGKGLAPPGRQGQAARRPRYLPGGGGMGPLETRNGTIRSKEPDLRAPRLSIDNASSARDLGVRASGVTRAKPLEAAYTLLAARFPGGPSGRGEAEAEEHRRFLEGRGFAPAFLRKTTVVELAKASVRFELCVGRFDSPRHRLIQEWLPRIRALRDTYAACHIAMIPRSNSRPPTVRH